MWYIRTYSQSDLEILVRNWLRSVLGLNPVTPPDIIWIDFDRASSGYKIQSNQTRCNLRLCFSRPYKRDRFSSVNVQKMADYVGHEFLLRGLIPDPHATYLIKEDRSVCLIFEFDSASNSQNIEYSLEALMIHLGQMVQTSKSKLSVPGQEKGLIP